MNFAWSKINHKLKKRNIEMKKTIYTYRLNDEDPWY